MTQEDKAEWATSNLVFKYSEDPNSYQQKHVYSGVIPAYSDDMISDPTKIGQSDLASRRNKVN